MTENGGPLPFHLSEDWFRAWCDAYLAPDAREIGVAGLTLVSDAPRLGPVRYRRLRSRTNVHTARSEISIAPASDLPALVRAARCDLMEIDYLSEDAPIVAAARQWRGRVRCEPFARVPVTDCGRPFGAWLADRGKRDRRRWPKLESAALAAGMAFTVDHGAGDLPALLRDLFDLEASGWKGREGGAIRCSPRDTLFYTQIALAAAAAGALRIAVLRHGDRIVAFEYGVIGGDRLFVLKAAFDEAWESHSPGHVIALQHIRHCCADPAIACYDVLGNGLSPAAHKLRFADRLETIYRIRLFARGWRGTLLWATANAEVGARMLRRRWRDRRAAAR